MQIKFDDKVALVTGATGTIGRSICHHLGDAGCRILAGHAGHHPGRADELVTKERAISRQIKLLQFDVADHDATQSAIREGEAAFGPIDILVNVAGITRDTRLQKMPREDWDRVIDVNLGGLFNTTRGVVEGMSQRGWGRVINISSINGQKGQFGQANYSAAKAGVHGLTMALAQEVARKGVTVNTVSPGYIDSPMVNAVPKDVRDAIQREIPVGRFGQPQDVAALVTFLASEQASWITGSDFSVNGGHFMH